MPELPEVEVTRRTISPLLVGRRLAQIHTTPESYFFLTPPDSLRRKLKGRRIEALRRHGKYLIANLDDRSRLLLHLGMTGQLFASGVSSVRLLSATARASLAPEDQLRFEPDKHTHLRLSFEDEGPEVFFRDVRKFGKVLWLKPGASDPRIERLGPDALSAKSEHLYQAARKRKVPIKTVLLDQKVLAGVGNIYADEALFSAGVLPTRGAKTLTIEEVKAIMQALKSVLLRSIETGGSSISDFVGADGHDGRYQDERRVYGRTQEACRECQTPIERVMISQRATHYCPKCQS